MAKIRLATADDLPAAITLIQRENKDSELTSEYLRWWYWENPFDSFSMVVLELAGRLEGMASTNNFIFRMDEQECLVALPQKVLTSSQVRGQGYFSKLYFKNESDNFENQRVDFLATFTNQLSTPIFLKKLGYVRGRSPPLVFLPPDPMGWFHRETKTKEVSKFATNYLDRHTLESCNYAVRKDAAYVRWRYYTPSGSQSSFRILEVHRGENILGYGILKRIRKKGLPIFLLVDVLTHNTSYVGAILRACHRYASRHIALGLLLLENDWVRPFLRSHFAKLRRLDRFNFLVKGKSPEESNCLAQLTFNFWFGDLDFI